MTQVFVQHAIRCNPLRAKRDTRNDRCHVAHGSMARSNVLHLHLITLCAVGASSRSPSTFEAGVFQVFEVSTPLLLEVHAEPSSIGLDYRKLTSFGFDNAAVPIRVGRQQRHFGARFGMFQR